MPKTIMLDVAGGILIAGALMGVVVIGAALCNDDYGSSRPIGVVMILLALGLAGWIVFCR